MSPQDFVQKWGPRGSAFRLNERAGAQAHFIDLCRLLDVPEPSDSETYCFERSLVKTGSGNGSADVWKRGFFAWEYKAPGKDLDAALRQLLMYTMPLENPPLLVVSDRLRIDIHTHFTGYPSERHLIKHEDLESHEARSLLRRIFTDPEYFKPRQSSLQITENAAGSFVMIADRMRGRGVTPQKAAHFLTQCVFCFFAEDVRLLPSRVFARLVANTVKPAEVQRKLAALFESMRDGGSFGVDDILWFNGGLFSCVEVPHLNVEDVEALRGASALDWSAIDPSIFGTLFERGLDPAKRSQFGAYYTDPLTIMRLVEPVVVRPLVREWSRRQGEIATLLSKRDYLRVRAKGIPSKTKSLRDRFARLRTEANRYERKANALFAEFLEELREFKILDPACGSGNFLYLALKAIKDIEHHANLVVERLGLERQLPVTGPHNLLGLEINPYAAELARTTIWIGELQWRRQNGFNWKTDPVLDSLNQIECRDALVNVDGSRAVWPKASVVVGNPPFIGNKRMRNELGVAYTTALRRAYADKVSAEADLVCYWFESAREAIVERGLGAAGLVATNSIRQGASRHVLDKIGETARIFDAWTDEPWGNDGAKVRVSLVSFGRCSEEALLNGTPTAAIPSDLSGHGSDLTSATSLVANGGTAFQGTSKVGSFEIPGEEARHWLLQANPHGRPNSDVVKPWANGQDLTQRPSDTWIVDFGVEMDEAAASMYELPFAHLLAKVKSERTKNNREAYRKYWWRHAEARSGLRRALKPLERYIATARVAKHKTFVWLPHTTLPDTATVCIARSDDTTFGCLQSRIHVVWAKELGSSLEDRPRYTPTSCFETFPFPEGFSPAETSRWGVETSSEGAVIPARLSPACRPHAEAIALAAKQLNEWRDAWLNPPEWTRRVQDVVPIGLERSPYPLRIEVKLGHEKDVALRTLTKLYNAQPTWLVRVHGALDTAVAAAYGWTDYSLSISDAEILKRLLALNRLRAAQPAKDVLALKPGRDELHAGAQKTLPLHLGGPSGLVGAGARPRRLQRDAVQKTTQGDPAAPSRSRTTAR